MTQAYNCDRKKCDNAMSFPPAYTLIKEYEMDEAKHYCTLKCLIKVKKRQLKIGEIIDWFMSGVGVGMIIGSSIIALAVYLLY